MPRPWQKYINDVLSGKRTAGRLERLAVERFLSLCEKPEYEFDEELANYYIDIASHCRHSKGDLQGQLWQWFDYQYFIIAYIFGLVHRESRLRLVTKFSLCMAKKGGKSELAGLIMFLFQFWTPDKTGQVLTAANKYDQALYSFNAFLSITKQFAEENEYINSCIEGGKALYNSRTHKEVQNRVTGTICRPVAADNSTLDGIDPTHAAIDELHAAKDMGIPENCESGMVNRPEPLLAFYSTRGFNSAGVYRQFEDVCIAVLEGKVEMDFLFPLIFSMDEGDDWEDESNWYKCMPGLGQAPKIDAIKREYEKAKGEGGTALVNFKTKNLNIWTNTESVWIQDHIWMQGATNYTEEELHGRKCYAGLDLASTRDIAALSLFFPPTDDEPARHVTRYYCPVDSIRERSRKDRVPYQNWVDQGWLIATPGNVIDYSFIEAQAYALAEVYDLQVVYYDRFNGSKLVPQLVDSGVNCEPFAQTTTYFNAPLKELERLTLGGQFDIGQDPILRWMAGNVVIYSDGNGNIKFNKAKCRDKIDGMVALGMAVAAWLDYRNNDPYSSIDWDGMMAVMDKRK